MAYVNGTLTVTSNSSGGGNPTGPVCGTDTIIINPEEVPLASLLPSPRNVKMINN